MANTRTASLVEGEYVLTAQDFQCLKAILYKDAGIALADGKATLLYSRLAKRLRTLGLADFAAYCELVQAPNGTSERGRMLAAMTTNVTRFFREEHHFDHLRETVLPPLLQAAQRGGKVRIWSAACSTGQEPYSIALTILRLLPDAERYDIRVLATDIDPDVVEYARAGQYTAAELEPVPAELRRRWFSGPDRDGMSQASEALRQMISVRQLNLFAEWPMRGGFDAVMCRNAAIYFDETSQAQLWSRFAGLLAPGCHLYIGHSERLVGAAIEMFNPAGITIHCRREAKR